MIEINTIGLLASILCFERGTGMDISRELDVDGIDMLFDRLSDQDIADRFGWAVSSAGVLRRYLRFRDKKTASSGCCCAGPDVQTTAISQEISA